MACGKPLKAIRLFDDFEGKNKIVFDATAYDTGFYHGSWIPDHNRLLIPCGQCTSCRIQKSREWANRLMMELQDHQEAWFVTLTYNNEHGRLAADDNGEVYEWLTLCKSDFQNFMKRLRKNSGQKLRFYACGEYGTDTYRPHYHAIIFGLHLDDLQVYKKSELGFLYYTSPFLDSVWSEEIEKLDLSTGKKVKVKEQIGYVVVAEVTWETCAYTARYVTKKMTGAESVFYEEMFLEPPFSLMSRKPGIAHDYYERNKDNIFTQEFINLSTDKGGLKFTPPKYFKRLGLMDENYSVVEDKSEQSSKMAVEKTKLKLSKCSYTLDELLAVEDRCFENRIKSLRRNIV